MPFPSPSSIPQSRGGGLGRRRRRFRRPWASGRGGEEGERGSGVREIDSPAHLGSGRGEGAGRREPAAAGGNGGGGGAVRCEERRWWPGKFGCGGAAPAGPFIAVVGRFGGAWPVASRWRPAGGAAGLNGARPRSRVVERRTGSEVVQGWRDVCGSGEHRAALCGAAAGGARRGQARTWARRSSRRCGLARSPRLGAPHARACERR